jgi:hypothetical protein
MNILEKMADLALFVTLRHPDRSAPRLSDSPWGQDTTCQVKS